MTTATQRSVRVPLAVGAIALTMGGFALVPSTARAADNVYSYYRYGCTVFDEDGTRSNEDPAGLSFDGVRTGVSSSPGSHTLSARSLSIAPDSSSQGEACDAAGQWKDQLTVGAGTSGLAAGTRVPVTVVLRLDGTLAETWAGDGQFGTEASYEARVSVISLDDCAYSDDAGSDVCDTPVDFSATHEHGLTGGPASAGIGGVDVSGKREDRFVTNVDGQGRDVYQDESRPGRADDTPLCDSWPCDAATHQLHPDGQQPLEITASATLVVGGHYALEGFLDAFSGASRNTAAQASATVDEFSLSLDPAAGSDGIDLQYASEGAAPPPPPAADTVPPTFHGVQDITVPAGPDGSAVVTYPFTVTDDVDATPTVTCTPPSGSRFSSRSYPVLCRATDDAGNSAEATFTVSLTDELPPVIGPLPDLTATASAWGTAVVTWTASATDNMGNATVSCTPPSGTAFPVGRTRVSCVATDEAGLTASRSFLVTVAPAPGTVLDRLYDVIRTSHTSAIYKTALLVSVRVTHSLYDAGNTRAGCTLLGLLDSSIRAATGHAIPASEGAVMSSLVYEARYTYNCH